MAEDTTTRKIAIAVVAVVIIGAGAWIMGTGGGDETVIPPAEEAPAVSQ